MASPIITMLIDNVVWNPGTNVATFTLIGNDRPAPPAGVNADSWYAGPGSVLSFDVPLKRATVTSPPTGTSVAQVGDRVVYTRWEYVSGAWVSRGQFNPDGTPYVA